MGGVGEKVVAARRNVRIGYEDMWVYVCVCVCVCVCVAVPERKAACVHFEGGVVVVTV